MIGSTAYWAPGIYLDWGENDNGIKNAVVEWDIYAAAVTIAEMIDARFRWDALAAGRGKFAPQDRMDTRLARIKACDHPLRDLLVKCLEGGLTPESEEMT